MLRPTHVSVMIERHAKGSGGAERTYYSPLLAHTKRVSQVTQLYSVFLLSLHVKGQVDHFESFIMPVADRLLVKIRGLSANVE